MFLPLPPRAALALAHVMFDDKLRLRTSQRLIAQHAISATDGSDDGKQRYPLRRLVSYVLG
jgi:hypothetical protein